METSCHVSNIEDVEMFVQLTWVWFSCQSLGKMQDNENDIINHEWKFLFVLFQLSLIIIYDSTDNLVDSKVLTVNDYR